jgi:CheY-like chemotaxis protein
MRLLDNAVQGATRGAALTQRMLAFARRQDLKVEPTDVAALVKNLEDLLRGTLGPTVILELDIPPDLPHALADANQLELAIINLAVNARDAMPQGGVIRIAARRETISDDGELLPAGRYVCLSIEDNGEGMDEATLARATEPFFTTKGAGKGTGLGLSMVQGLAAQLGGRLHLESKQRYGTKVELVIPVSRARAREAGATIEDREHETVRPLTILAVDDDALVLMNTVAMLEDLGHTAFEASSGAKALEFFENRTVDLVITDQAMPRMSGTELARAIRAKWPTLPIIIATGYAELPAGSELKLPRLGKPFAQADLRRMISATVSH